MNERTRSILVMLVFGLIAGWLASFVVGGGNPLRYVISGLAGGVVGGFLLQTFGVNIGIKNKLAADMITAVIGAIVVVLLARIIA